MTATNHVITGALIATYIHNPWVAIPVAFAAHFALDCLPHFDYPPKIYRSLSFVIWLAIDCGLAAAILATLLFLQPDGVYRLVACAIACASPDTMWVYYKIIKNDVTPRLWLARFHTAIQKHTATRYWPIELVWLIGAGTLLVNHL